LGKSGLKEKGSKVLKDGKDIYGDASRKAKAIIDEAKHRAEELKKEADRHLSEARQKAKGMLVRREEKGGKASESPKDVPGGREV